MNKHSKRYRLAREKFDRAKVFNLADAVALIKDEPAVKFDSGVELHIKTEIDVKDSTQQIRGMVKLPHGTGKKVRVWAICENAKAATEAGAVRAGGEELIKELQANNKIDFDILLSEPAFMPKLAPLAKILGPRGLMPSPKSGTVTVDVVKAIKELAGGKVSFKSDDTGNIHFLVGRVSFDVDKLKENIQTAFTALKASRPPSVKGSFIKSTTICSTMGQGIKVALA